MNLFEGSVNDNNPMETWYAYKDILRKMAREISMRELHYLERLTMFVILTVTANYLIPLNFYFLLSSYERSTVARDKIILEL